MDQEEKKLNRIAYALLAIIVIVVAVFIVSNSVNSNEFSYKGPTGETFNFVTGNIGKIPIYNLKVYINYGDALIKPIEIPLRNRPKDVESIAIEGDVRAKIITSTGIFITQDPLLPVETSVAGIQLAKVLGTADYSVFKIPTQGAFTESLTENPEYPVKTCKDATQNTRVILLQQGPENKVYVKGECVIVQGTDSNNLIKAAERTVYALLQVM